MPEPQLVRLEVRFGFDRDLILASKIALDSRLCEGAAIEGASQRRYLRTAGFLTTLAQIVVKTTAIRNQGPGTCVCQVPRTDMPLAPPLHNLEQEELEVVGFGYAPYDGMVG